MQRKAVSEVLGAIVLLAVTVVAFVVITPFVTNSAQTQASDVIQQYRTGVIKQGELLSFIYHFEGTTIIRIGVFNFGTSAVKPQFVFIYGVQTSSWLLKAGNSSATVLCRPNTQATCTGIKPNQLAVVEITITPPAGAYQFFMYSYDNLAYSWTA